MDRDKLYCVKFHYSLAKYSGFAVDELGIYFSKRKIKKKSGNYMNYEPQVATPEGIPLTERRSWVCFSKPYKPEGKKAFLTLGNFNSDDENTILKMDDFIKIKNSPEASMLRSSAYYLIDLVEVYEISDSSKCFCEIIPEIEFIHEIVEDSTSADTLAIESRSFILKNVFFATDKFVILDESYNELEKLYLLLNDRPEIKIEISGHTDNTGSESHNRKLSAARAKSIQKYLVGRGISVSRLTYKGMGSSNPLADNATEEGRALNRRVECRITGGKQ